MSNQRAFSAGEVSPALYGRADVDRWRQGLKTCRNFVTMPEGGIKNRQGFVLRADLGVISEPLLVPWEFGPTDSYVLIMHDGVMNLIKNGSRVVGDTVIYGATLNRGTTPWTVTTPYVHGYATNDTVRVSGTNYVVTVTTTTAFTLNTTTATSGTATVWARRVTLASGTAPAASVPFAMNLASLRWVQSGDTMYFADGVNNPKRLVRDNLTGVSRDLSWIVEAAPLTGAVSTSATLTATGTAGTSQVRYRITYTDRDGVEGAAMRSPTATGTCAAGSPWPITSTAHGLITNDQIYVTENKLDNNGELVYRVGDVLRVVYVDANTFTVSGPSSGASGNTTANFKYAKLGPSALLTSPATGAEVTVTWSAVTGADFYNVYREFGRVFGYIGSTSAVTFVDNGTIPDTKDTPSIGIEPNRPDLTTAYNQPVAVGIFQQRLVFGGYADDVERITTSHSGNYRDFDPGAADSTGVDFSLAGNTVAGVRHLVEIGGRAIALTSTSEWELKGGTTGGITPTAINARTASYYGCSNIPPVLIGASLLFVQRGDKILRDAKYDDGIASLNSVELTRWARHLVEDPLARIAYQRSEGLVWAVRSDGVLLGLTYLPEDNIWGWHRHEIAGREVVDACCVSENNIDRLYIVTKDGTSYRVCQLPEDWISDSVDDHTGFDESLTYDGRGYYTGTLTLSGTGWTTRDTLTLRSTLSTFSGGDVGKTIALYAGSESVLVLVTAYATATEVSVRPYNIVPDSLRGAAESNALCASTVTGLTHLNGETVGVIGDGSREPNRVPSGGSITLTRPFARVQVGIPITCEAQTLDLESTDKDTMLGDFKHITRVILLVTRTRGAKAGIVGTELEDMIVEYPTSLVNAVPALQSGAREIIMQGVHDVDGSVLIRQTDGLPTTVLNCRVSYNYGDKR